MFAALVGAPIPFGSVDTLWVGVWTALLAASLLTAPYDDLVPRDMVAIGCALGALGLYLAVAAIQLLPLPQGAGDPIWSDVAPVLGEEPVHRFATGGFRPGPFGPPLLFALAGLRVYLYARDRARARSVRLVIGRAAIALAVLAGALQFLEPAMVLWREKTAHLQSFTGTFLNRNTTAAYFGIALVIWVRELAANLRVRAVPMSDARNALWLASRRVPRPVALSGAACLVCLCALAATASRAGMILAGTAALLLAVDQARRAAGGRNPFRGMALAAALALLAFELVSGRVGLRLQQQGLSDDGRLSVWSAVLSMTEKRPFLGYGLGRFADAFPAWRPEAVGSFGIWDRAHSTPLEIAAEMGWPVAMVLAAGWATVVGVLWRAHRRRAHGAVACALAVAVIGVLHSCVDYPLQIPGYAVAYAAVVAAGLASAVRALDSRSNEQR